MAHRFHSTSFWGKVVQPAINFVMRDNTLRFLDEIADLPYLSRAEAEQYQYERLRDLLQHCYRNVPYYGDLFRERSLTPDDIVSFEDLKKLPVLKRETVVKNREKFIARNISRSDLFPKSTGGSTGAPLNIFHDRRYWHRSEAGLLRCFMMAGYRVGEPVVNFWAYPENLLEVPGWQQAMRQKLRRRYYFDTGRYGAEDLRYWHRRCMEIQPSIIYGYASAIYHFARFLKTQGNRLTSIKGVFTTTEKLYPFQRELIAEAFDCKVYDTYGCVEVLHLSFECPHGRMHRASDFSYIETKRDGTSDIEYFIVTSLWNYGFPLIRYMNNDAGRLLDGECTCGRGFPLLDLDISRIVDNFPTPNGKLIHGTTLMHLLYGCEGIDRYQYYQPGIDEVVLYVVKADDFSSATVEWLDGVKRRMEEMTDGSMRFEIRYVDDIPRTERGKYLYIRSDVYEDALRGGDR
jgi:phenylacetate-CoA ligase